jgi:hypothetical protein
MTLKVTSNNIEILNSNGVTKFSASQPLLYVAGYEYGSIDMGGGTDGNGLAVFRAHNYIQLATPIADNEVDILYVTITGVSGFGDPAQTLLNVRQPANAVLPIYIRGYANSNTPASDQTNLSIAPHGNMGYYLHLQNYGTNNNLVMTCVSTSQGMSQPTLSFDWELYKYRYLDV